MFSQNYTSIGSTMWYIATRIDAKGGFIFMLFVFNGGSAIMFSNYYHNSNCWLTWFEAVEIYSIFSDFPQVLKTSQMVFHL